MIPSTHKKKHTDEKKTLNQLLSGWKPECAFGQVDSKSGSDAYGDSREFIAYKKNIQFRPKIMTFMVPIHFV